MHQEMNLVNAPYNIQFKELQANTQNPIPSLEQLQKLLFWKGPFIVSIDASRLGNYQGHILEPDVVSPTTPREYIFHHLVSVVGFDSVVTEEGRRFFWICKNCWGPYWGNHGYMAVFFERMHGFTPDPKKGKAKFEKIFYLDNGVEIKVNRAGYEQSRNEMSRIDFHDHGFSFHNYSQNWPYTLTKQTQIQTFVDTTSGGLPPIPPSYQHYMTYTCEKNRFQVTLNGPVFKMGNCNLAWLYTSTDVLSVALSINYFQMTRHPRFVVISPHIYQERFKDTFAIINYQDKSIPPVKIPFLIWDPDHGILSRKQPATWSFLECERSGSPSYFMAIYNGFLNGGNGPLPVIGSNPPKMALATLSIQTTGREPTPPRVSM